MMKNAQMAEKTNLTKLIHNLVIKLNDPKEIVRTEIESLLIMLSYVSYSINIFFLAHEDKISCPQLAPYVQNIQS